MGERTEMSEENSLRRRGIDTKGMDLTHKKYIQGDTIKPYFYSLVSPIARAGISREI